jgi:hypothetical protein
MVENRGFMATISYPRSGLFDSSSGVRREGEGGTGGIFGSILHNLWFFPHENNHPINGQLLGDIQERSLAKTKKQISQISVYIL